MLAGTIERRDRAPAVDHDPLCFHFWKCDPAAYFEYLAAPGTLSDMFGKPSTIACGVEDAIDSISKAETARKG